MSWQCPYCETVNNDAVPICTVCERVAPVVESFLSLEQIDHAREYEELLSEVYTFEASGDYENMLTSALKAASTFNQNDIAVNKIHLAVKLQIEKSLRDKILKSLTKSIEKEQYLEAQACIRFWSFFKFDKSLIDSYSEIVETELTLIAKKRTLSDGISKNIIDGKPLEALKIVETEILENPDAPELKELRSKIQELIKASNSSKKRNAFPVPQELKPNQLNQNLKKKKTTPIEKKVKRKFPPIKR